MTSLRAFCLTLAAAALTACGFTPLHSTGPDDSAFGALRTELAASIAVADKEAAFWVEQSIKDRLGAGENARHILRLFPEAARTGIGISGDDVATRYDTGLKVSYELIDMKSGDVLDRGSVRSTSTIAASTDPYALTAAEKASVRSISKDAADRVLARVAAHYSSAK